MEFRQLTVLLIEDDEDDYVLVRSLLSEVPYYKFHLDWVATYDAGLEAIERGRYDVCLLDYRLGERNGLELLREAIAKESKAPIIFLTGQGDYEVDVEAMRAGAADYLVKGKIDVPVLERSIRYAIERKRAEEELRNSEQRFRNLVETVNEGLGLQDEKGLLTYANEKFCEMLGYSREELIGRPVMDLFDEANRLILEDEMDKSRRGERASYEIELLTESGRRVPTIISTSPVFDESGTFRGGIAAFTDVTSIKQAAEALRESEEQFRSLACRLLSAQEDERKRIAGELHRRIDASLSAVKFNLEALRKRIEKNEVAPEALAGLISMIQDVMNESRRIIEDLRPAMLDDLGIAATTGWFCKEFQRTFPDIDIERKIAVKDGEVPESLKIVIFRVIQEAFHNIARSSRTERVDLSLTQRDGAIELCIEDNGIGFDLHSVLSEQNSSEVGLTCMKERTELSGGSFVIESGSEKGTRICASWPLRAGER